jgi:hypothetical protein
MSKKTPIKYTSRDFNSIKQDLVEHAKRYYPENYNDFNESSFGSMMLDAVSYVGDIMSFYLDYQVNESFLETALEPNNVRRLARRYGYKYVGAPAAFGTATFYVLIPAATSGLGPDRNYIPVMRTGSKFKSSGGEIFLLTEDVDFADAKNETVAARFNDNTGKPTYYAIRAHGQVRSGTFYSSEIPVGTFERNRKVYVGDVFVNSIESVVDSEGHPYYQVDALSQDVVYVEVVNQTAQADGVPSIMKPFKVPRRYIVIQDDSGTWLQFGFGSDSEETVQNIADPSSVALKMTGKNYITDSSFDPNDLLDTGKLGVSPADTTLKVIYGRNATTNIGVSATQLNAVVNMKYSFPNTGLSSALKTGVISSLEVTNDEAITSETRLPSPEETKIRAYGAHASQNRAVTRNDYEALVYLMPKKFGSIKRASVVNDPSSASRKLSLYVISDDGNDNFATTNSAVKNNLKVWLNKNRMLNDAVEIVDAKIINLAFDYTVTVDPSYDKYGVMAAVNKKIQSDFLNEKMFIGEPLYISKLYQLINGVSGVIDTKSIKFNTKHSGQYSSVTVNINDLYSNDGSYLKAPKNVVFEIKFPSTDIRGSVQ